MAIGTKNLVRIKMMDYIINVMLVKEHNQRMIHSMAEEALRKMLGEKPAE